MFKAGDKVIIHGYPAPYDVLGVHGYDVWVKGPVGPATYRIESLTPYIRPLQVGDRVTSGAGSRGTILFQYDDESVVLLPGTGIHVYSTDRLTLA